MAYHQTAREAGFTLLEMSIVIAIIGVLMGAVVATQSYVKSARMTTMMNEAKLQIDAFEQFQKKYNAVPGDFLTAANIWGTNASTGVTAAGNGDGNSVIRTTTGCSATPATCNKAELFYSFQHLARAGLITGNYTGCSSDGCGSGNYYAKAGENVPATAVIGSAMLFDHPDAMDGNVASDSLYFDGLYFHVLTIAGLADNATSLPASVFLTPKEMTQLDQKYDDGRPGLGWLMAPKFSTLGNCSTSDTAATSTYSTTYAGVACYLILRMQ